MTPQGPLGRRIAARKGQPIRVILKDQPDPERDGVYVVKRPAWLERLTARDETGRLS